MKHITITYEKRSMKGLTGSWSKWGGRRFNALDNQLGSGSDTWYCQCCGMEQPVTLSPMKVEIGDLGFIRVCSECFVEDAYNKITLFENPD